MTCWRIFRTVLGSSSEVMCHHFFLPTKTTKNIRLFVHTPYGGFNGLAWPDLHKSRSDDRYFKQVHLSLHTHRMVLCVHRQWIFVDFNCA